MMKMVKNVKMVYTCDRGVGCVHLMQLVKIVKILKLMTIVFLESEWFNF